MSGLLFFLRLMQKFPEPAPCQNRQIQAQDSPAANHCESGERGELRAVFLQPLVQERNSQDKGEIPEKGRQASAEEAGQDICQGIASCRGLGAGGIGAVLRGAASLKKISSQAVYGQKRDKIDQDANGSVELFRGQEAAGRIGSAQPCLGQKGGQVDGCNDAEAVYKNGCQIGQGQAGGGPEEPLPASGGGSPIPCGPVYKREEQSGHGDKHKLHS